MNEQQRWHDLFALAWLLQLYLRHIQEGEPLPDVLKERALETIDRLLKELPAEELCKSLTVEQRLEGLSLKERLRGLSAEELRQLAEMLEAKGAPGKPE